MLAHGISREPKKIAKTMYNFCGSVRPVVTQADQQKATIRWLFLLAPVSSRQSTKMKKARIELVAAAVKLIAAVVELVTKILF